MYVPCIIGIDELFNPWFETPKILETQSCITCECNTSFFFFISCCKTCQLREMASNFPRKTDHYRFYTTPSVPPTKCEMRMWGQKLKKGMNSFDTHSIELKAIPTGPTAIGMCHLINISLDQNLDFDYRGDTQFTYVDIHFPQLDFIPSISFRLSKV